MRINAKRKIKPGTRFVCVKMSELNKVVSHGEEREKMSLILARVGKGGRAKALYVPSTRKYYGVLCQ